MGGIVPGLGRFPARLGVAALCLYYPVLDVHSCAGTEGTPVVERRAEPASAPREPSATDIALELEHLARRWSEAVSRGDVEAVIDLLADDATLVLPGEPLLEGRDAIDERLRRLFEGLDLEGFDVRVKAETHEQGVVGDRAYQRYTTRTVLRPRTGGESRVRKGKGIRILERDAHGCWRIVREVWSGPGLPAADGPVRRGEPGEPEGGIPLYIA